MVLEHTFQVICVDGLAPFELEPNHIRAVARSQGRKPLAEVAGQSHDDLVARRHEVCHRRLEPAGP